jgi:hypothetical protein
MKKDEKYTVYSGGLHHVLGMDGDRGPFWLTPGKIWSEARTDFSAEELAEMDTTAWEIKPVSVQDSQGRDVSRGAIFPEG